MIGIPRTHHNIRVALACLAQVGRTRDSWQALLSVRRQTPIRSSHHHLPWRTDRPSGSEAIHPSD